MRNPRKWTGVLVLAVLFSVPFTSSALAAGNPATKLTRGIVNLATGWIEVPVQMAERKSYDDTKVMWLVHGLLEGVRQAGRRTLMGAWDVITFPIAPYDRPTLDPDTLIEPDDPPREIGPMPTEEESPAPAS